MKKKIYSYVQFVAYGYSSANKTVFISYSYVKEGNTEHYSGIWRLIAFSR